MAGKNNDVLPYTLLDHARYNLQNVGPEGSFTAGGLASLPKI